MTYNVLSGTLSLYTATATVTTCIITANTDDVLPNISVALFATQLAVETE